MKLLIIILVVAVLVAVLLAARRSGPRITTIEHKRGDHEKPEDRDDA